MASTYKQSAHDIGITNVLAGGAGTDVIGMMLAKKQDGSPAWEEYDGKFLVEQFFTGAASVTNMNPEEELHLVQDDWRSGFGLEYADSNDPKRYYSSIGADLRFRGMALAGPTPQTATLPVHTASAYNQAINWSDPGSEWTNEAQAINGNTVNGATVAQKSGWTTYLEIYIPPIRCSKIRYYWTEVFGDDVTDLEIDVYYGGAWHAVVTDDSQGEGVLREEALGDTYTVTGARCRFQLANNDDAILHVLEFYGESAVIQGTTTCHADFNTHLYFNKGNALLKMAGDTGTITVIEAYAVDITALEPFSDDQLYIAQGLSNNSWEMTTSNVSTRYAGTYPQMKYLKQVNTTADTMYGSFAVNTIRATVAPEQGGTNYSNPATVVGGSDYDITGLLSFGGALYIMKQDMPYYLDSSGNVQKDLAQELTNLYATTSGKNAFVWKKKIYIPCGAQGLLETDGTSNTFRNPARYCTNLTAFVGRVVAVTGDEEYLYIITENATEVEVLAGREETVDGTTSWVWHPISHITLTNCETAWISSIYKKRLWISSDTATESLYFIDLPTGYGDMANDANREFLTTSYFITSWLHGGFKSDKKAFISITASLGHAHDAAIYWECHYQVLGDGTVDTGWTDAGNLVGTATVRNHTLYLPDDASDNKPISEMIRFKFVAVTDDPDITPELLNFDVKALLYPNIKKMYHAVIKCSDEMLLKDGMIDKGKHDLIKATLDNARNNTWPVAIRDIDGTTDYMKFLPVPQSLQRMMILKEEKGRRNREKLYHVLMLDVPLS